MTSREPPGAGDPRTLHRVRQAALLAAALLPALLLGACSAHRAEIVPTGKTERGVASWYGPDFHGKMTASGEIFDTHRLTAAHRKLPFGTLVEVRNLENGKAVRVRINDRGPFVHGRIIDLSNAAADQIGMLANGTARVELKVLPFGTIPMDDPVLAGLPRFTVQVGAFGDAARARALCEEIHARYPEAVVSDDGAWHRVQVGQFDDRTLAEGLRLELEKLGFAAMIVVLR
ncbi:MAG: septal ring lytic transglycosylase RlpA family protein [Acidobacteriota bacterium]